MAGGNGERRRPTAGEYGSATHRLTRWRSIFAGWQLGTRPDSDPECQAVRDHRELSMLLRAEVTAITGLLIRKGIITEEEFDAELDAELEQEAALLEAAYQRRFPGFKATDEGMQIDVQVARHTMRGWRP